MSIPSLSLAGKVAIVSGGKSGIGRAITLAFAEAGADVAVCGRVLEGELQAVSEEVKKLGRRSLAIRADISKKADVDNLVQKVMEQFGVIDILVNNAVVNFASPFLELSEEGWDKIMNIGLKGYYLCSQAVGKIMVEQKRGSIINMASSVIMQVRENVGAYCIAKAGVAMLTRVLARELGKYGVRANAIAPSFVKTERLRFRWTDPAHVKEYISGVPLGRIAEPSDIIGVALFLASDASSYITGHTVLVDGGKST